MISLLPTAHQLGLLLDARIAISAAQSHLGRGDLAAALKYLESARESLDEVKDIIDAAIADMQNHNLPLEEK